MTIQRKTPIIWILVADGKQAKVYARAAHRKRIPLSEGTKHRHYEESTVRDLVPVAGMAWKAESPKIYEAGRNKTAMVFESMGKSRHMSAPKIDARKEVKQHFAVLIAEKLNAAKAKKKFDRLVLAAPPRMLGELREHLSKKTLAAIIAELPKELTRYDKSALANHLGHLV